MKVIMAILMSMVMAIALVPCASAVTSVGPGNMPGTAWQANSTSAGHTVAVGAVHDPAGADYSCVSTPAYTGYVEVHPTPCPANGRPLQTPRVMGGWE